MLFFLIWLAATVWMFWTGDLAVPFVCGTGLATVVAMLKEIPRSRRRAALTRVYEALYGAAPTTGAFRTTGYGAAAGVLAGHYVAGALIGAALDLIHEGTIRQNTTSEQTRLLNELAATRVGLGWRKGPFVGMMLFLSVGARWVLSILQGH